MSNESQSTTQQDVTESSSVELPQSTISPFVLAVGLMLLAFGIATHSAFAGVGVVMFFVGLGTWVAHLMPGRGHFSVVLEEEPSPPSTTRKQTDIKDVKEGEPGYRLRLPEKVHPISAGVKGGIAGGAVMTIPALLYGLLSGHGLWYPVNLLTGMVLPNIETMTSAELSQFHATLAIVAILIHAVMSVIVGLTYGVLMPTLPSVPKPLAWGAILMPVMWTAVTFAAMRFINPVLSRDISWPWFIASQVIYGLVAAAAVMWLRIGKTRHPAVEGLLGGMAAGLAMTIPAFLWAIFHGHAIWYPINLLAGMVQRGMVDLPGQELQKFHRDWFLIASLIHMTLSLGFGLIFGLVLPRLRPIPRPIVWGALLLPLLWTSSAYGLIGVVNPLLDSRVDWPWFIVSQFIFGVVTAIIVVRSESIPIPPAGGKPSPS